MVNTLATLIKDLCLTKYVFDKGNYLIEVQDRNNSKDLARIYCLPDAVISSCKGYLLYFPQSFTIVNPVFT